MWLGWRWLALSDRIDRAWNRARDRVDEWFLGEPIDAAIDGALARKVVTERLAGRDFMPPSAN